MQGTGKSNGFVLHSRRFRENSRILELLTRDAGRIAVVARVAKKNSGTQAALYQPFRELALRWRGRGELQNLLSAEEQQHFSLSSQASLCGLYCNELLLTLTSKFVPMPEIFLGYRETMAALSREDSYAPVLRRFEVLLLEQLGYGFNLHTDALTGEPLPESDHYFFHPVTGLSVSNPGGGGIRVTAEAVDAIRRRDFSRQSSAKAVKMMLGSAIDNLLDGRPLKSRQLFREFVKQKK